MHAYLLLLLLLQSLKKLAVLPLFACLQIAIAAAFAAVSSRT
jgi:hypothetical protein